MLSSLYLASALWTVALAANDWSKPCFSGVCRYDLPASSGKASGTLEIWGAEGAIADVTSAAGWEIIDCSPKALKQDIRLVCKKGRANDCARLFNAGAVGKVVRLPENCGRNAFGMIAEEYVPADQSIPAAFAGSLMRRDGSLPDVHALKITTDFKPKGPSRKTGGVNFAIRAANVPGASGPLDAASTLEGRSASRVFKRGFFDWVIDAIKKIAELNNFNVEKSKALPSLDVSKDLVLIDESVSCPPLAANLKVEVTAKAQAAASIGVAVTGTIVPPKVDDFAVIASLSAELDGSLDIDASVTGAADSGNVRLVDVALPGLSFPGIFEVGPSFQINAQANANLDIELGMEVDVNYKITNAQFVFPPKTNLSSGGGFHVAENTLKLSASPGVRATGSVEAHIVPVLSIGLSALGGAADAQVFLNLDASATLDLDFQASANGGVTISEVSSAAQQLDTAELAQVERLDDSIDARAVTGDASFSGCVDVGAGLNVNAGASADFFGIFNKETSVSVYSKEFDIFKKCYGGSTQKRSPSSRVFSSRYLDLPRRAPRSERPELFERKVLNLLCPAKNIPDPQTLV
ncbi:hypothetical protein D9613_010284 [Agrocybe pediades]|uniref:DUF7223 domain-containing protein n=1 Tax=Agrocybe pediades TaxID=84607 RepID=A0A8H4VJM6_9AGAR|nr:hypothetical protein D9613_010284 [Agrocybe pediades]